VTPIILQLVQSAICPQPGQPAKRSGKASSPVKAIRKEKSKSQEPDSSAAESDDLCSVLVNQVNFLGRNIKLCNKGKSKYNKINHS
jgi:hypothetical protein